MNIKINEEKLVTDVGYSWLDLSIDNQQVRFWLGTNNVLNIEVMNASHREWKGGGKYFRNFDEACKYYKNTKIMAMINFAKDRFLNKQEAQS